LYRKELAMKRISMYSMDRVPSKKGKKKGAEIEREYSRCMHAKVGVLFLLKNIVCKVCELHTLMGSYIL